MISGHSLNPIDPTSKVVSSRPVLLTPIANLLEAQSNTFDTGSHSRRPMRAAKTNRRNWTEMDRDEEEEEDDCVILNDHDYTSKRGKMSQRIRPKDTSNIAKYAEVMKIKSTDTELKFVGKLSNLVFTASLRQDPVEYYNSVRNILIEGQPIKEIQEKRDEDGTLFTNVVCHEFTPTQEDLILLYTLTLLHPELPSCIKEKYEKLLLADPNHRMLDYKDQILKDARDFLSQVQTSPFVYDQCSSYNYNRINSAKESPTEMTALPSSLSGNNTTSLFSLIDLSLDLGSENSLKDFYERIREVFVQNLASVGDFVRWKQTGPLTEDEKLAPSHENILFIYMLSLFHPNFPASVCYDNEMKTYLHDTSVLERAEELILVKIPQERITGNVYTRHQTINLKQKEKHTVHVTIDRLHQVPRSDKECQVLKLANIQEFIENDGGIFKLLKLQETLASAEDLYHSTRNIIMDTLGKTGDLVDWKDEPLAADEELTPSHEDTILFLILTFLDPQLPLFIRDLYGYRIGRGKRLMDFKTEIFQDIELFLSDDETTRETRLFSAQTKEKVMVSLSDPLCGDMKVEMDVMDPLLPNHVLEDSKEDLLDSLRQEEEKAKKVDVVEFSLQPLPLEDYRGHADDDYFVCDICNLSVHTQPLLDRHMKIKHCWKVSNDDINNTDRSNVASETVSSLETARKVEARDRDRFCCLFCAFTVDNQLSVENHIENEHLDEPFPSVVDITHNFTLDTATNIPNIEDAGTVQTDILVDVVPLPADHPTFIPFDQALNMIDHQSIIPIGQSIELSTTISQSSDLETSFSKLVSQSESTSQSFPSGSQSKSTDKSRRWGASVQLRPPFSRDFEQQQAISSIMPPNDENIPAEETTNKKKKKRAQMIRRGAITKMHTKICRICPDSVRFASVAELKEHANSVHEGYRYACPDCKSYFKRDTELRQHLRSVHPTTAMAKLSNLCGLCKFKTTSKLDMQNHMLEAHDGFRYGCGLCTVRTKKMTEQKEHFNTAHGGFGYQCDQCSQKFASDRRLKTHRFEMHEASLLCDKCPFVGLNPLSLKTHMKNHEPKDLLCHLCDYRTQKQRLLTSHISVHHERNRFQCEKCDYSCAHKPRLDEHVHMEHPENGGQARRLKCDQCDYVTNRVNNLRRHIRLHHLGFRYKCDQCDYSSMKTQHVKHHKEMKHGGELLQCPQCPYSTRRSDQFRDHVLFKHEGHRLKCQHCGEGGFDTRAKLSAHTQRMHYTGKAGGGKVLHKGYKVPLTDKRRCECGYVAKTSQAFRLHMKIKHKQFEGVHECDLCNFKTDYKRLLIHHQKGHGSFPCKHCDFVANRKSQLLEHRLVHAEKLFRCDECTYVATRSELLRSHVNAVHLRISINCELCEYSTFWTQDFKKHMKKKHNGEIKTE